MRISHNKSRNIISQLFVIFILASLIVTPFSVAHARYFDPNDIFTDDELFDGNALSRTAIQTFLDSKNSVLARTTETVNGLPKLVSEMIFELGQQYNISQKFLLAKLQHEQGLIEKSSATEKAIDWATGFSCYNNQCNDKYKGIYAQLDAAASVQKIYAERSKSSGYFSYEIGKTTKTSDKQLVTPSNQATANLYIYTPYQGGKTGIGGNYAFWRVWNRYFTERSFADGALLQHDITGDYYIIENNKKRKFDSASVYLSYHNQQDATTVTSTQLSYYQTAAPIIYANNTVVKGDASGITYLLSDGIKHRVLGSLALTTLGYRIAEVDLKTLPVVAESMLDAYTEGEPITDTSAYPQGTLLKSSSNSIYYVKQGIKYPVVDEAVWQLNFNSADALHVSDAVLNNFTLGSPVVLRDGSVVKDSAGNYYIIANQTKHPVTSGAIIMREYGSALYNAVPTASSATLSAFDTVDTIDYIDDTILDPAQYISYADRVGANQVVQNNPATTPTYVAIFEAIDVPSPLLASATQTATISFRNRGTTEWQTGKVFLKLIDENSSTSSFVSNNRIALTNTVASGGIATFSVPLTAPAGGGSVSEWFIVEYLDAAGAYMEMPGGLVGKRIHTATGISAQVTKNTIPVAIRNTWKPITVSVTVKNTSADEIWTSRRAAFSLVDEQGNASPFYDKSDWIDKTIVGVPMNKSSIKPGETGVITFTLDPRGVKPGTYTLRFSLELRDTKKTVYLNGLKTWERLIRVDK